VCLDTRERARLPAALAASLGLLLLVILAYLGFRRGWSHYIGADQFQLFTGWKLGPKELMLHCLSKQKDVLNIYATFHFLWFPFLLMLWQLYQENGWRDKFVLSCGYLVLALLFGRLFATDANRVFVMLAPWVVGLAALYFQRIRLRENPPALLALVFIYLAINYGWVENREWQIAFDTVALLILAVQSHRMSRTPASSAQG
jgi:dolichol kinase